MRLLHSLMRGVTEALVWLVPYGGNGRPLGGGDGTAHLYRVERTTPPADRHARRYWHPWRIENHRISPFFVLNPICGRIDSRSRYPRISTITGTNHWTPRCDACARIGGASANYLNVVQSEDPWQAIRNAGQLNYDAGWWETADPVTGL